MRARRCVQAGLLMVLLSSTAARAEVPWLELEAASLQLRYQFVENSLGTTTVDHLQHKQQVQGRLWLNSGRSLSLNALVYGGSGITGGWNGTGWGSDAATNLWVRHLFLSLEPAKQVYLHYGGLGMVRGQSTEITTYDNDAYLVGGRLKVERPDLLFFDELSVTYGYVGDTRTPNVFRRLDRWDESNYHQFLLQKSLSSRLSVSLDYSFQAGIETLREAARVSVAETGVLDSIRFETYQRLDAARDFGFALQGEKALHPRVRVGGGYADIDPAYGGLNADRFKIGRRLFAVANLTPFRDLKVELFVHRAVANDFNVSNQTRVDVIFNYNLLSAVRNGF